MMLNVCFLCFALCLVYLSFDLLFFSVWTIAHTHTQAVGADGGMTGMEGLDEEPFVKETGYRYMRMLRC